MKTLSTITLLSILKVLLLILSSATVIKWRNLYNTYISKGIRGTRTTYFTGEGWWTTGLLRGGESLRVRLSRLSLERERLRVRDRFCENCKLYI